MIMSLMLLISESLFPSVTVCRCLTGLTTMVMCASLLSCCLSAPLTSRKQTTSCLTPFTRSDTWPTRSVTLSAVSTLHLSCITGSMSVLTASSFSTEENRVNEKVNVTFEWWIHILKPKTNRTKAVRLNLDKISITEHWEVSFWLDTSWNTSYRNYNLNLYHYKVYPQF